MIPPDFSIMSNEDQGYEEIIRVIADIHCARGPARCEKCKEAAKERTPCLLRIYVNEGRVTRPVIELERDGQRFFMVFDVVKRFNSVQEARDYAEEYGVEDIEF